MESLKQKAFEYLPVLIQAVFCGLVVWMRWSLKKIFVRHEDLNAYKAVVGNRLDEIEERQADYASAQELLKQKLDTLPTSQEIQSISLALRGLEGDIQSLNEKLDGQSRALGRVEKSVDDLIAVHMEAGR